MLPRRNLTRSIRRFPPDFVFSLTRGESRNISQIVSCSSIRHAKNVSALTEQGVAMLSSVWKDMLVAPRWGRTAGQQEG